VGTDKAGLYRISLPIGTYTIQVTAPGFEMVKQVPFELDLAQRTLTSRPATASSTT
jgi:hypothetical protein